MPRKNYQEQLAYNREWRRKNPDKAKASDKRKWIKMKSDPVLLSAHRRKQAYRMALWREKNPVKVSESMRRQTNANGWLDIQQQNVITRNIGSG
jgi:hypothetical protein